MWVLRLCDLDPATQRLKTESSYRLVPIHAELVKCGFLAYVAELKRQGEERVFPTLGNGNKYRIWSNAVGKWWARYLDDIGLTDIRLDYHSFRYCFRQQCSLCGVDPEVRDALTGHWSEDSDSGRRYLRGEHKQYPLPKLAASVKLLSYDELDLSHLYVADPMLGVDRKAFI